MDARLLPVDNQTLYERVYERLREAIMNGDFTSGETLTIRGLAQQLGTSAMPAREALRRLATEGALEVLPNRSIRIPDMDAARIEEICRLRTLLEGEAASRAAQRRTAHEMQAIRGFHREFTAGVRAGSAPRLLLAGQRFHFAVYEAARLPTTLSMIRMLWLQSGPWLGGPLRRTFSRQETRAFAEFVLARHQDLLDALEAGDPGRASTAVATELDGAAQHLLTLTEGIRSNGTGIGK